DRLRHRGESEPSPLVNGNTRLGFARVPLGGDLALMPHRGAGPGHPLRPDPLVNLPQRRLDSIPLRAHGHLLTAMMPRATPRLGYHATLVRTMSGGNE